MGAASPESTILLPNFAISITQLAGVSGIIYGAEWNTALTGTWTPIADTDPSATGFTFSVSIGSETKIFMRLKVAGQ